MSLEWSTQRTEALKVSSEKKGEASQAEVRVKNYFEDLYSRLFIEHPNLFESVRRYKSDGFFHDISAFKRMGEDGFKKYLTGCGIKMEEIEERSKETAPIVENIEKFLAVSELPEDIAVYRMVSRTTLDKIKNSGEYFTDNGFVSTCYTIRDAKNYHKEMCIKINIPAGTKVIDMASVLKNTHWNTSANWENELVIGDGYDYEVLQSDSKDYELILNLIHSEDDSSNVVY